MVHRQRVIGRERKGFEGSLVLKVERGWSRVNEGDKDEAIVTVLGRLGEDEGYEGGGTWAMVSVAKEVVHFVGKDKDHGNGEDKDRGSAELWWCPSPQRP
ncbi:hypothetical protein V6N13_124940 [Hibiscus sabdariffa]